MINKKWSDISVLESLTNLSKDIVLEATAPGGQVGYRKTLAQSFFIRFVNNVNKDIGLTKVVDKSSIKMIEKKLSFGTQAYDLPPDGQLKMDPVGRPLVHATAYQQADGSAIYVDDMPIHQNELFLAPVFSSVAHAEIDKIDFSAALQMEGIVGIVDGSDVPGNNSYGQFSKEEMAFVTAEIRSVGEVLIGILGISRNIAKTAAAKVKVSYKNIQTPILTIADSIRANSFYQDKEQSLKCGDFAKAWKQAHYKIEGTIRIGNQEHFYFEPQSSLIIPKEDGEIEAFVASQNPTYTQSSIAKLLGVSQSRVNVRVKRLGGGFGGKEMRHMLIAGPAAVAARKFNRPVRCILDRDEDMCSSGTRHPVYAQYKLGAQQDGHLTIFEATYYLNAGYSLDLSGHVAASVLWASTNSYDIPNVSVTAKLCKTNTPSNTAFRAFGSPQSLLVIEKAVSEMAEKIGSSQNEIRELNLLKTGDVKPTGQVLKNCTLQRCWYECKQMANFVDRIKDILEYNKRNKYKKKALTMAPVCFAIGYRVKFLHQAGALVNIYTDGSVLVTHGGVEMGQGLHTKLLQVASRVLNISMDKIFIAETATDKIPNTSATAASLTTDLNAPAVVDACNQLRERLATFMHNNPKSKWEDWVQQAYFEGVNLSAKGFFHDPNVHHDPTNLKGEPFTYYVYGAACSEVELDALTGDHVVRTVDIVMDVGASINPAIDIGQIEGAFMQGYGLYTLEEQQYSPSGHLLTKGPGTYKIPGFGDIPERLTVQILKGSLCEYKHAVYSSKAVGEPPLCLAVSVYSALREAVLQARKENGADIEPENWQLDSPATSERLRMAVGDSIALQNATTSKLQPNQKPWSVHLS